MTDKRKLIFPLVAIILGTATAFALMRYQPTVERREVVAPPPLVRVIEARRTDVPLNVGSQGTVEPRTSSTLVAEVGGRIVEVGQDFAEGGFFDADQVLVRIDPRDYELAVAQAQAAVAQAQVHLELEQAEALVAAQEWAELGRGPASPLSLREPQVAEARAALAGAEATLDAARLALERTVVRAPYQGRVRRKLADIGQFLTPGTPLAELYAVDWAEIRLPVSQDQLAYLGLDLAGGSRGADLGLPAVSLRGTLGGREHSWSGRISRAAGEIDPRSRMLHLFARVEDPFALRHPQSVSPLPVGLFVEATLQGPVARDVIVLPRGALRSEDQVLVVDEESRLRFRSVEVLRVQGDDALITAGLEAGTRVCISTLNAVVEGMAVRVFVEVEPEDDPSEPRL